MWRSVLLIILMVALAGCSSMRFTGWGSTPEEESADVREIDTAPAERRADEEQAASGTRAGAAEDEVPEGEPAESAGEPAARAETADTADTAPPAAEESASEPEAPATEQAAASSPEPASEPEPAAAPEPATASQPEPRSDDLSGVIGLHANVPQADHPPLTDGEYQALQSELSRMEQAGEDTSNYRDEIERGRSEGGVMAWFYRRWLESRVSETPVFFYR